MTSKPILNTTPLQYISESGAVSQQLPEFARNPRNLVPLYRAMLLTRGFDEKAVALQRTGRLGTYPSSLGQEAVGVGVAAAMNENDILLPSFREQSAMLWRGVSMTELLLYWGGDEAGSNFAKAANDFPICVPVGTHFCHAAGVSFALKSKGSDSVAVAIAGDGSTSKGDFYEAMNLAGIWQLPVVFVINNNQWAISVPRSKQTASETLAHKAVAAGIAGVQVDGNDVVGVREAILEAIERARKHNQPSLIEAITYRLTDHTTADDASRYRGDKEVSAQWANEPIKRLRAYLEQHAGWSRTEEEQLMNRISKKIDAAVEEYLGACSQPVESCFDYLYAEIPESLKRQRQAAAALSQSDA